MKTHLAVSSKIVRDAVGDRGNARLETNLAHSVCARLPVIPWSPLYNGASYERIFINQARGFTLAFLEPDADSECGLP